MFYEQIRNNEKKSSTSASLKYLPLAASSSLPVTRPLAPRYGGWPVTETEICRVRVCLPFYKQIPLCSIIPSSIGVKI
jgi:hypothetical protein